MYLQIVSDLHIEYKNTENVNIIDYIDVPINANKTILVLAGDIGSLYQYDQLLSFLRDCSNHYHTLLYVPGNHEFYYKDEQDHLRFDVLMNRFMQLSDSIDNLIVLNRGIVTIGEYAIIGCTLWSYIKYLPKFRVRIHGMTKQQYNKMHRDDYVFISQALRQYSNYKCIVITHHGPSYKLLPLNKLFNKYSDLYVSKSDNLFKDCVKYWIYGHTHHNVEKIINNTKIVCNQRGHTKNKAYNYDRKKIIIL